MKERKTISAKKRKAEPAQIIIAVIMGLWALMLLFPFYNAFLASISTQKEFSQNPLMLFPKEVTFSAYAYLLKATNLLVGYKNTFFMLVAGVPFSMIITVATGYAMSRPAYPGKKLFVLLILFTMYFSGGMVPLYLLMKDLHLTNKLIGIVLLSQDAEGKLYMIPNVIYLNPPTESTDIILDPKVLYYRKDWAKAVGIEVGETITTEQIAELAQAFIEQDPGENGAGKTVGITSLPAYIDSVFVQSHNAFFNQFYKNDSGEYVWGGFDDSTLEGVKSLRKYYDMGIIDPDYYAFKGKEHYEKFDSGIAGMFYDGASAANVNERFESFKRSNPDIVPSDAIGLAVVVGDDGVFRGEQNVLNYWAGLLFRPDLDDETMARILSILDYACTEEGQRLIHCGIEGRDYTMDGDDIVITRDKDADGNFVSIADLYPSYNFFFTKAVLPDDWSARDPSLPDAVREQAVNMFHVKEKTADLIAPDYDIVLFDGEKKLKFPLLINDIITEMVVSGDDIDSRWAGFKSDNSQTVQSVLDEVNAALN